jgi:hypothetical protein
VKSQNSVLSRRTVSEPALWTWSCATIPTYTLLREQSCSYAQLEELILQTARDAKTGRKKMFQIEAIDHVALIVQDLEPPLLNNWDEIMNSLESTSTPDCGHSSW